MDRSHYEVRRFKAYMMPHINVFHACVQLIHGNDFKVVPWGGEWGWRGGEGALGKGCIHGQSSPLETVKSV